MDGITYEPQEGDIEDESEIESEEKDNEDELNTEIDMEITVIDKKTIVSSVVSFFLKTNPFLMYAILLMISLMIVKLSWKSKNVLMVF